MENKKEKKESCSFLFKIISECNDNCPFCLEHESIKSERPRMTFSDFKKNLFFLKKLYNPNYIIISGGEPTLHSDFFKMLRYLKDEGYGFRFITNLISLSDTEYAEKVKKVFSDFQGIEQQKKCKIVASINDAPLKSETARRRYKGLKNLIDLKLPFVVVITIYNENAKYLPEVAKEISRIIKNKSEDSVYNVEFRMIYHIKTMTSLLEKTLPGEALEIGKSLDECAEIFDVPNISMTLWNFPLCYIKNYEKIENGGIEERKKRKIIRINIDEQFEKHNVEDWLDYFKKYDDCKNCVMGNYCTGVDEGYIKSDYYQNIKSIK